ncbi:heavy metal-associated isoprenylated plant protein 9 [Impatiens glandulifera]|uniref:heavy metal-associated isoprenylated plant protein 9 n=1 Tax=Impatiens glandulifera TaxID=253017 RepID=UPI001FB107F4|nr:heavy metal-associated isoprenylated plant protein 9 [Impatiens glandulifera]
MGAAEELAAAAPNSSKEDQAITEDQQKKSTDEEDKKKKEEEAPPPPPPPKPPAPFVIYIDLHCVGCAKKIEKSIMKIRGVEGVNIEMETNQVTIKGIVEPQVVCSKLMKRTKRMARVLSPLPVSDDQPIPDIVTSQVSGLVTVELNVNMHCEACAQQLKKKILKMRGVRSATTDLSSEKVTVTGTMDGNKLVDYVYRHTKKQAKIVPQPEPEPKPEPESKPDDKKEEEPKTEQGEEKKDPTDEKKEDGSAGAGEGEKKEESAPESAPEEEKKEGGSGEEVMNITEEQAMQRMVYYYQPLYVMERIPPPQLFSDENPNACSIT